MNLPVLQPWNIVFLIGFLAYLGIRHEFGRRTVGAEKAVRRVDVLEKTLLLLVISGSLLLPALYLFTPWLGFADYRLPAWAPWCGTAAMIAALWLFWRSHADLGLNWSVTLEMRKDHQLVRHGVFRWIRHPMYASIWLFAIAQALLLENALAGWSALVTFAPLYFLRTPREERMMGEFFGQAYRDYMAQTGRLFPRIQRTKDAAAGRTAKAVGKQRALFWRDVGLPIGVSMGLFCLLNLCWNARIPDIALYRVVPEQVGVYLVGSCVALVFLARAFRSGTLSAGEVGLGRGAWTPRRRLVGLAMTLALMSMRFATLADVPASAAFGDFCFWFLFLLPASMVELLIFVSLGFCLPERWLRDRGWRPWSAVLLAAFFSGVTFGLYHYTHEQRWHALAPQLIVVMWIGLSCFVLTRNWQLTFLLHNAVAAVGFTEEQYHTSEDLLNPAAYQHAATIAIYVVTFAVPYLLLHAVEWWQWPGAQSQPARP